MILHLSVQERGCGGRVGTNEQDMSNAQLHAAAAAAAAAKSLQSCLTICDPIDSSPSGSPILGFSKQEHWSGLQFASPMHESEK